MDQKDIIPDRIEWEKRYRVNEKAYLSLLKKTAAIIENCLMEKNIAATIKIRIKSFDSFYKKILRKLREPHQKRHALITDLLGIRIVCPFLETISIVEEMIHELFSVTEIEKKGNNHTYREFGYESTHLLIALPEHPLSPEGYPLECAEIQVRTILQEAWAEVEHELVYKAGFNPFDTPLKRKLAALNANLTLSDLIFQEIRDYQRQLQKELGRRRHMFSQIISDRTHLPDSPEKKESEGEQQNGDNSNEDEMPGISSQSLDELLLRGLLSHNSGKYQLAIKIYTELLKKDDSKVQALVHVHRGMAYFAESDYQKAVEDFSRALELNPKNSRTYYLRGITCRMISDYSQALDDFNSAISLDAGQFDFWFARAQLYYHSGDYPAALKDCKAAMKLDEESEELKKFYTMVKKKSRLF